MEPELLKWSWTLSKAAYADSIEAWSAATKQPFAKSLEELESLVAQGSCVCFAYALKHEEGNVAQYTVCVRGDTVFVSFSGTDLDQPVDWINNISIIPAEIPDSGGLMVQSSMLATVQFHADDIFSHILDLIGHLQCSSVVFSGHSLGGALATICSWHFAAQNRRSPPIHVFTFGSPSTFCKLSKEDSHVYKRVSLVHVVHASDPIPRLLHVSASDFTKMAQQRMGFAALFASALLEKIKKLTWLRHSYLWHGRCIACEADRVEFYVDSSPVFVFQRASWSHDDDHAVAAYDRCVENVLQKLQDGHAAAVRGGGAQAETEGE